MDRVLTRKGAVVELIIVTAGVLIALSVDTMREWRSNRVLAAEARVNIQDEIRQNLQQIETVISGFKEARTDLGKARSLAQSRLDGEAPGGGSLNLGFRLAGLSSAADETAEITGAFSHMDNLEVQRFAGVYRMQRQFDAAQDRALIDVGMLTASADGALDDDRPPDPEALRAWIGRVEAAVGAVNLRYQMATLLKPAYELLLTQPSAYSRVSSAAGKRPRPRRRPVASPPLRRPSSAACRSRSA